MASRSRSFLTSRSVRGSRRKVSWTVGPNGSSGLITTASTVVFPTGLQALVDDLTLVRMRGEIAFSITGTNIRDGFDAIAVGMAVVTENAFGVGVTAVPAPLTDINWDGWLFHWSGSMAAMLAAAENEATQYRLVIDNKAMRKMHESDVIVAVIEVATETGTASLEAILNTRTLFKLA